MTSILAKTYSNLTAVTRVPIARETRSASPCDMTSAGPQ